MLQMAESTPNSWFGPARGTVAMDIKQPITVRVTRQFSDQVALVGHGHSCLLVPCILTKKLETIQR